MRKFAFVLVAALIAGIGTFAPAAAPSASAATGPKVAIIVGATHSATSTYRTYANQIYAEAIKFTSNVVKVYSPTATWSKVKSAVNGASIIVYLGHGNGWPSPYTYDSKYTTKDGFGLNYDANGDGKLSDYENKYYGEPSIRTLTPAPNAVVLLFHLCYASGNSEPGDAAPSLSTAKQRVDNYAAAFLAAGARAVIADGHSHDPYYINALFTTNQTIDQYWRNAPNFHNGVKTYSSTRSSGYTYQLDPESSTSYYRSIAGKMSLTTQQVTGASYAGTSGDPVQMVVPGNASTTVDGAQVYDAPEAVGAGVEPASTMPLDTLVRVDEKSASIAPDGSAIFRVHADGGATGWMSGSTLRPRDSLAPRVWETDNGAGVFSPNGDGTQDSIALSATLSESSTWSMKVLDGGGKSLASKSGTGDSPAMTWAPAASSVADGTYTWHIEATDSLGNGPMKWDGDVEVDTRAPVVSVADAESSSIPYFAPNGDGARDTISFGVGSNEPGTVLAAAIDDANHTADTFSTSVGSSTTLTWDGKGSSGFVDDGRYGVQIRVRDAAGNTSDPQTRTVDVYGALGYVASSKKIFYPQDNDAVSRSTGLSFHLYDPATVTWRILNSSGTTVRTLMSDEAVAQGTISRGWDGRSDSGSFVPKGAYRSYVRASNGTQYSTQAVSLVVDAFKIAVSDTTPARGQKITITATSAEALGKMPRVAVYQPGRGTWTAGMYKVSNGVYRVTLTLRSSSKGTLRLKVYGYDKAGQYQWSHIYLPLH